MDDSDLVKFRAEWQREVQEKTRVQKKTQISPGRPASISNLSLITTTEEPERKTFIKSQTRPGDRSNVKNEVAPAKAVLLGGQLVASERLDQSKTEPVHDSTQATEDDNMAQTKPCTALEHYELGISFERRGLLSDALNHYRKAFKLDSNIDKLYRDIFRAQEKTGVVGEQSATTLEGNDYAKFIQTTHDYDPKSSQKPCAEFEELIRIFHSIRMPIVTDGMSKAADISSLPEELLRQIISYTMQVSPSSFTAISLTCQKLCLISQSDHSIWRDVCFAAYHDQNYVDKGVRLDSLTAKAEYGRKLSEELNDRFHADWKRMFIEKPRIRIDGCYIATCHYTRPGVREESFTNSFHLVTYFRFLRFYPSGTCLSLLTTAQPADVVHQIVLGTKLKGVQQGRWSMTRAGELFIEATGPASYLFFMSLRIKSSSKGRQNKLQWDRFDGTHPVTGEVTHFNLRNDKPFYFSKVMSYDR